MSKKLFLLLLFVVSSSSFSAMRIEAIVLDANTHREIYGVNIFIDGTNIGTISGRSGSFELIVPDDHTKARLQFQHISYDVRSLPIDSVTTQKIVYLTPRVIPLQDVQVVGESAVHSIEIKRDIPQSIKVLDAGKFDIRGYVDAGDFLNTEPAVQVQEELSGKKTLSIRGGNADDVVVLYNGVRMNSPFDNVFDFSLIDLANLERFEVIKGSNTSLYGPEAFSGVINIVPQIERDYTLFTQYRIGTYNTENLNFQINKGYKNVDISYSYKDASQLRRFVGAADDSESLKNLQQHHNANVNLSIGAGNTLNAMYSKADLSYDNGRDAERISQQNDIASLKYTGAVGGVSHIRLFSAYRSYDEQQQLNYAGLDLDRHIQDKSLQFDADKTFKSEQFDVLLGYNFRSVGVDFIDDRYENAASLFYQAAHIKRFHHGAVGIIKTRGNAGDGFLQTFNVDFSLRYDNLEDRVDESEFRTSQPNVTPGVSDNSWEAAQFKFSTSVDGYCDDLAFKGFFNYGGNTKFPTVVQRLSVPLTSTQQIIELSPEKVKSYEAGLEVFKEAAAGSVLDGWHAEASVFRNYYTDKFRPFSSPGIPVVFYDNVAIAEIFGMEAGFNIYFLKKKIDLEFGLAKYDIAEKSAFPFKSDFKRTLDLTIDHAGFSLMLHWFYESDQVAWIRTFDGEFAQVSLEPFTNLDVHFSKSFRIKKAKFFVNLSGRNVIEQNDVVLQGLAIRDNRAYVTLGAQF